MELVVEMTRALLWVWVAAMLVGARRLARRIAALCLAVFACLVILCSVGAPKIEFDAAWHLVEGTVAAALASMFLVALVRGYLRYRRVRRVVARHFRGNYSRKRRLDADPPSNRRR